MMASLFQTVVDRLLEEEGGYANDPRDDGGETLYGISRNAHPPAAGDLERHFWSLVDQAKADGSVIARSDLRVIAIKIYKQYYWDACNCDQLPPCLAILVFDAAVQHGAARRRDDAPAMLQRALRVPDDGVIGPKTIEAARKASHTHVLRDFQTERLLHYSALPDWVHYGKGWTRRLLNMFAFALQYADDFA